MKEKVVLAYSGGLDTTAIIPWLKETFDYEVICFCINVGQGEELNGLEERAKMSGASKLYIKISLMNSVKTISFLVFRPMQFMRTNIYLVLPWLVLASPRSLLKLQEKKMLLRSVMGQQVKVMTRFVSNLVSKHWLLTSRLSLHGV